MPVDDACCVFTCWKLHSKAEYPFRDCRGDRWRLTGTVRFRWLCRSSPAHLRIIFDYIKEIADPAAPGGWRAQ